MKRNTSILLCLLLTAVVLALGTCRNPLLSVGLGDRVDITPPGIRLIDSDGVQNGAYVHGTITIQGTSTDDIAVASVVWTFTDAKTSTVSPPAFATLDAEKKNWSFSLNTAQAGALYKDGEKNFLFTVEDSAGKTTETRMMLIFDNGSPVAMVNQPASEADLLNGSVRLSGEAYDPYGVQKVSVKLYNTAIAGSPLNGADGAVADGTNAWNYSFDSTTLTTTSGTFWFEVIVEDRAGNTSSHQYLYPAVFAANADKQVTIDKIAQLEAGDIAAYQDLDATELPGLQKGRQQLSIDQDSDKPTFIISSPVGGDIVGFNSRVVGLVMDDDGVRNGASDIKVHVWKASGIPDFGWGNAAPSGSGLSVRFSYALNMISASGDYKLQVQATDINGVTATSPEVIFTVDAGIPAVNVDPLARVYFNDNETLHLTGTAQSIGGQVNEVELSIGATAVLATLASPGGETTAWTCDFPLAGISELPTPNKTLVAEATDTHLGMPKTGSTNLFLIVDNTPPQARFVSPTNGSSVYNLVSLRGNTSDNSSLTKVELRLGKVGTGAGDGFVEVTGSLYDWVRDFLSNDYANATQSTAGAGSTWIMPVYCRVYDTAGNVATNEPSNPVDPLYPAALAATYGGALTFNPADVPVYTLVIDLDRDKPTITIQTPRDNTNVAGTVVASGSCYDESPGMDKVEIRIEAIRDDDSPIGYVTPAGAAIGAPGWIVVPWIGGQRSYWQQSLNENEKLYNVGASGGAYEGEPAHHGKYHLSVRPTDLGGKVGNEQTVTFRLDDTIPRLESPKLTLNGTDTPAVDYLYARGTIHLKARARDNLQVTSIKLSTNGGSSYGGELIGTGSVTPAAPSDYFDLDYTLDTKGAEIPAALLAAKNGLLTLGVKVQDNATPAPYVNTWFVTLNMDNLFPTVSYTGTSGNGHDPMALSGNRTSSSQVMGTSADGGTVGGIDAVEVYLVRGTDVINLADGTPVPWVAEDFGDPAVAAPYTTNAACKVVIDWSKVGAVDNMQLVQNGSDVDWWVKLNTIPLADGLVDIHYVARDRAGNATHGVTAGKIVNHVPMIDSIILGTNVNGDGAVGDIASGESKEFFSGYSTTGFTVRNGMLKVTVNASSGNGTKRYSLKYGGTTEKNTTLTSNVVTITDFTGMPDGAPNGSTFSLLVYDSTVSDDPDPTGELSAGATLGMTFDNTDLTPPTVAIAPFGQRYGTGASDALRTLATVGSYNDNIVMNVTVRTGHVEYQGQSLYGGADADVSGQVIFRGKAHDNQRIDRITVQIPGYDPPDPDGGGPLGDPGGAGTEFDVAAWSAGALVPVYGGVLTSTNTWSTEIEAPSLTEVDGHTVNWAFSWNSAAIATRAQVDVAVTVRVYDHATPANSDSDPVTVDVVPYITAVKTTQTANGGIKANNIRSSLGRYSIKTGVIANFITIEGFNLAPIANGVRISSATWPSGLNGTTLVGNALAVNSVSADWTVLTVGQAATASGYLSVVSGTAGSPVPSVNNINGNDSFVDINGDTVAQLAEKYNREPDELAVKNRLLTDDRYIDFFTVTDTGLASSFFPNMIMSADTPVWGYVQGTAANDLQVRRGTSSASNIGMVRILSADQLAMARDDDGFYHMASINNFNAGRMVYIYNVFETTPGYANGGATSPYWVGYTGVYANAAANNAIELDSINYGSLSLGRYTGLQMVVKGRSNTAGQYSRVYLGFYDQSTGELLFRNFRVGLAGGAQTLYSTGRSNQADVTVTAGDASRKLVTSSASQYFAMGVTDQNRVVFVYFDQAAGRLKVTTSTAAIDLANPTDAVTFSAPVEIPVDYVGWYVSLAVESDGNALTDDPLHIAAYDSGDGDLRYIHMTSYADASPQVVRVDANNSVGIYTSILVQGGKPWISYYNNSENGTRDSIKLARYLGSMVTIADGASSDGYATGQWETLTVPVITPPQGGLTKFLWVNLGFNTASDPILGYAASSIEASRRLPEVTP
jgi:hypothetical protein